MHFPPTSSTSIFSLKNKPTRIREHHKRPFTIGGPVLNSLGPLDVLLSVLVLCKLSFFLPLGWICYLNVCNRRLTVFLWQMRIKKHSSQTRILDSGSSIIESKDNSEVVFKRPILDSIFRRLPMSADVCFERPCRRLFSLLSDSLYLAQIFCTVLLLQLNCAAITWF